jgi:hypothetical protein
VIVVVDDDPAWPGRFEALRHEYATAMAAAGFLSLRSSTSGARPAVREPARLAGTNTYVIVNDCLSLSNHLGLRDVHRAQVIKCRLTPSCRDNRDQFP